MKCPECNRVMRNVPTDTAWICDYCVATWTRVKSIRQVGILDMVKAVPGMPEDKALIMKDGKPVGVIENLAPSSDECPVCELAKERNRVSPVGARCVEHFSDERHPECIWHRLDGPCSGCENERKRQTRDAPKPALCLDPIDLSKVIRTQSSDSCWRCGSKEPLCWECRPHPSNNTPSTHWSHSCSGSWSGWIDKGQPCHGCGKTEVEASSKEAAK